VLRVQTPDESASLAASFLEELKLDKSSLNQLETLPADRLAVAAQRAGGPNRRGSWAPMVDGRILPTHPFDPVAPELSRNVPLLVGTNLNEGVNGCDNPNVDALTEEELRKRVTERYGSKAAAIIEAYKKEYPRAKPFDRWSVINAAGIRENAFTQADRKAMQGGAPVYQYLFAWHTPQLDGRPRAFHSAEIAFVFNNAGLCTNLSGGLPEAHKLSERVSGAWINFARTGDPNHKSLPNWPAYNVDKRPTMVFDTRCEVHSDPEGEGRRLLRG
jgi:para-nitrobenzyl esterase